MKRTAAMLTALMLVATSAGAQNDMALAKEAYDRGTQAHARGDVRTASAEFARADALAPSAVALQAALDAAVDADDVLLGAELLERSKRAPATGALAASIDAARKKLGERAGRVKVACPSGARCAATLDGAAFDPARGVFTRVGTHTLVIQVDDGSDSRSVDVHGGEDMEVIAARAGTLPAKAGAGPAAAPAPSAPPHATAGAATDARAPKPLSPVLFAVGAGFTAALGVTSTLLGLTAASKHSTFVDAGCDRLSTGDCPELKSSGEQAQTLANIGFAATALVGAATVVTGVFFTDWGGAAKVAKAPVLAPISGGIAASWGAAF